MTFWDWFKKNVLGIAVGAAVATGTIVAVNQVNTPEALKQETPDVSTPSSKTLVGLNCQLNYGQGDLSDTEFLNTLDSIHSMVFRRPGGTVSDSFIANAYYVQGNVDLFNKTGCTIDLVLNLISSNMQTQLNVIDAHKEAGIPVNKMIYELGNEFNTASRQEMLDKYGSVDAFAKECKKWYDAIKRQYPEAIIGIPGGNTNGKQFKNYNDIMLAQMPDTYLVFHYHNPRRYTKNGIVDTALVHYLIDSVKQAMFGNFPWNRLMVTETNLRNEDIPTQVDDFANDYQHGLAVTTMFEHFANHGVYVVNFHNSVGADDNGAVEWSNKKPHLSATGRAIREFTSNYKN